VNEFWNFSVRAYARSGVKSACLTFQSAGLDVNVGLWIIWICVNGRDPGPALDQAVALSALARSCPEHGSERLETLVMSRMQDYAARLGVSAVVTDLFVENVFGSIRNT